MMQRDAGVLYEDPLCWCFVCMSWARAIARPRCYHILVALVRFDLPRCRYCRSRVDTRSTSVPLQQEKAPNTAV